MNQLILLRHAETLQGSAGTDDLERPLSPRGEEEARAAGQWLAEHGVRPDRALCSHSERTRQTCRLALSALEQAVPTQEEKAIYEASPGELLAVLEPHRDIANVLLVGHNPGIERLVALLTEGRSDAFRGMPPGGLAVLHLDGPLEPGRARLDAFWSP